MFTLWNFDLYRNDAVKKAPRNIPLTTARDFPIRDPDLFFALDALFQGPRFSRRCRILEFIFIRTKTF